MFYTLVSQLKNVLTSPGWILVFIILFNVAYFVFAHEGFYWIDDYGYAKYAWEVMTGKFSVLQNSAEHPNNPLTHRVLTFIPVAFFYWLFGVNIYTTTLWPLLCTIGCSITIFLLFRKQNPLVAILAMLLLGLNFHSLFLSSYLFSDNIIMFFALIGAVIYFKLRFSLTNKNQKLYAFLFVLANFAAYLAKESILYYVPFYIFVLVLDLVEKKHQTFWLWVIITGLLVAGGYFGFYYFTTGDPFYRFHIYEKANIDDDYATAIKLPFSYYIPRLTYQPFLFFIGTGIYIPFIFALGVLKNSILRDIIFLKKPEYFWLLLASTILIFLWFGTTAFGFYNPLPLLPRFYTPLMPPLCISAAYGINKYLQNGRRMALYFAIAFFIPLLVDRSNTLIMYLPLALFFSFAWWFEWKRSGKIHPGIVIAVLVFVLSLRPLHFMQKTTLMSFQEEHEIVTGYLNKTEGNNLVLADRWQNKMFDFHYKFKPNQHYTYHQYLDTLNYEKYDNVYLLINRSNLSNPDMADWQTVQEPQLNNKFPKRELIVQKGNVALYKIE